MAFTREGFIETLHDDAPFLTIVVAHSSHVISAPSEQSSSLGQLQKDTMYGSYVGCKRKSPMQRVCWKQEVKTTKLRRNGLGGTLMQDKAAHKIERPEEQRHEQWNPLR